ncbi:tetratricopeptide repeat protein [Mucilaginibacter psychrotolerans]|uniref:Sel1 repeat family protein n=1 Tax=Mucilaginibacter psychrotolerans TaxID=1524096 RepID=A0A4Y8SGF0_9SPHI|nr:tetratricopeptide repeat protein [Mucilaginibacter psychrotolerans]TFF37952.1 sel1 repeat family protein [Mucilaginibacter psychrotolerans]
MTDRIEIKNIDDWNSLLAKAENGDSEAQNEVSSYYEDGLTINDAIIVKIDKQLAFNWTKKSYQSGDIQGIERYANYLCDGEYKYCEKDVNLAMQLYEKAMDAGSGTAAYNLGLEYRNKQNFGKAFELYSKGNQSELTIGLCYYYGIGIEKDKVKALEFFNAVNKGYNTEYDINEANFLIGKMYLEGDVVERSIEKARYYLELADNDGDHRSAQELLIVIGRRKMIN